jgi:lipopolysaccharide/colanic/teichoic acid biosynthesis glycosyltransferase
MSASLAGLEVCERGARFSMHYSAHTIEEPDHRPVRFKDAPAQIAGTGIYTRFGKRLTDVSLVILMAPVIVPVVLLLCLLAALDGGCPLYCQERVGRGGNRFRMWKLRSMVKDADALLETHLTANPAARVEWDTRQKLSNDPRITPIGRFTRKSSLDELPQLWNVLRGEMSLVGPRPMMGCQEALYPGKDYYRLRPGITGPWQVSMRNKAVFADRAAFDSEYSKSLSALNDAKLLLKTVVIVLRGTGC